MSARNYLNRPLTQVRRKDRRLNEVEWQDRLLTLAPVGHLAVVWDGQPLITTSLFWYDGTTVYMHAAAVGKLRAVLDAGPHTACFSVSEMGRLLPADTPLDFSTEYASVMLYGQADVVTAPSEKRRVLDGLMAKYAPHLTVGVDYRLMPESDVDLTSVFRITVVERVGKHNVKPADYPAYPYPGGSFIDEERAAGRATIKAKDLA